jgi:hypothetical protein
MKNSQTIFRAQFSEYCGEISRSWHTHSLCGRLEDESLAKHRKTVKVSMVSSSKACPVFLMAFLTCAYPLPAFAFLTLFTFLEAIPDLSLSETLRVACLNQKGGRHMLG